MKRQAIKLVDLLVQIDDFDFKDAPACVLHLPCIGLNTTKQNEEEIP
jgi:hypothetical protein